MVGAKDGPTKRATNKTVWCLKMKRTCQCHMQETLTFKVPAFKITIICMHMCDIFCVCMGLGARCLHWLSSFFVVFLRFVFFLGQGLTVQPWPARPLPVVQSELKSTELLLSLSLSLPLPLPGLKAWAMAPGVFFYILFLCVDVYMPVPVVI